MGGAAAQTAIYRTYPLGARADGITSALILVHGASRDGHNYFRHALAAAFLAGALERTVVIAPRFASTDGGVRFKRSTAPDDPETRDNPVGGGNMKTIDVSAKLPNRLYGVANKNYYNGWEANQVFISIDRGQVWKRSPMLGLPKNTVCTSIVADFSSNFTRMSALGPYLRRAAETIPASSVSMTSSLPTFFSRAICPSASKIS